MWASQKPKPQLQSETSHRSPCGHQATQRQAKEGLEGGREEGGRREGERKVGGGRERREGDREDSNSASNCTDLSVLFLLIFCWKYSKNTEIECLGCNTFVWANIKKLLNLLQKH